MVARRLFVADTVFAAVADTWHALRAMPVLTLCAAAIILALEIGQSFIPRGYREAPPSGLLLGVALDAVRSFCLAPFMIAVARFVILGAVTRGYIIDPAKPGFLRFVGWLLALSVIVLLAFNVPDLVASAGFTELASLVLFIAALVAVIILALRLNILFPALAVDAKHAGAANAIADTRGFLFRIFLVFALILVPPAIVSIVVTFILGAGVGIPGSEAASAHLVAGAIIQAVTIPLFVAAASRLYQALGNRLGPPA